MTALRVAVWGLGPHAIKNILPALEASAGVELTGVHSRSSAVVSATCAERGCRSWKSAEAMLADPGVDAVYIATPISLHAQQGSSVLRAGKHLWCEKPIAMRAAQAEALVDLSRDRGLIVAEGFMYLYHAQFIQLRTMILSGRLGRLATIVCRFGIPPLERPSFRTNPDLGGGAFLDVGSYPISAITAFFPDSDPEVSFAEIVVAPASKVDTEGRALLRYEGVTSVFLEWRIDGAYRNEIDVWGTDGSVFSERIFSKPADYVPRLRILDRQGRETIEIGRAENHFVTMVNTFRGLVGNAVAAEAERSRILRQARLMDRIQDRSQSSGAT